MVKQKSTGRPVFFDAWIISGVSFFLNITPVPPSKIHVANGIKAPGSLL
jgi:hypothetical protein